MGKVASSLLGGWTPLSRFDTVGRMINFRHLVVGEKLDIVVTSESGRQFRRFGLNLAEGWERG